MKRVAQLHENEWDASIIEVLLECTGKLWNDIFRYRIRQRTP